MKNHRMLRAFVIAALLGLTGHSALSAPINDAQGCQSCDWKQWQTVGRAELKVLFFDVYNSTLFSPTGDYQVSQDVSPHPLALSIEYQRSISREQLLDATYEQWIKQGYDKAQSKQWIAQLATIFPSVKEGQRLTYITNGESGRFEFSPNVNSNQSLGTIDDEQLNDAFLAIWLSPKTEYSDLRKHLIGQVK
ncbi:hypothetical protein VII00023_15181 [Vibrio ichthyoenteri ATCC 700023]|uniref:Chalcone isomerase domain-containing protein n=1 Tax=Vibrio ichthyoenteri ATCC 700023 TaxID=870968 RepID=F9S6W9_9VIBR|nr:chalcone isomerase family protein [Vibrio ichthyoenteri]EGU32250.1 hypothetical protein VII00023_15181 [Vibrio ichthyoenteri ATCC 700023]